MAETPAAPTPPEHRPQRLPEHQVRLAPPAVRNPIPFALDPGTGERQAIAAALGISALRKFAFTGTLTPRDRTDWAFEARLGATVVQPCVVTLAPVTTRIDETVSRLYMADLPEPEAGETEMSDDDVEALPVRLDIYEIALEALSLALPAWPRAEGAELSETVVTEPGAIPMDSEAARPFAGLSGLRDRLTDPNKE